MSKDDSGQMNIGRSGLSSKDDISVESMPQFFKLALTMEGVL